jgi:FKBP-type peptidyl-prolyl cis-trans isomerase
MERPSRWLIQKSRKKMISGIKLIEEIEGIGREAIKGDIVEFESKGYLNQSECIQERLMMTTKIGKRDVIAGIEYALIGMKEGSYRKVKISPHLGYRDEGVVGKIPPNAVLVYELWLHRIK